MTNKVVDKHGLHEIFPASANTIRRLRERGEDPFPHGRKIGGKRYWDPEEVFRWLDRQDKKPDTEGEAAIDHRPGEAADAPAGMPAVGAG